MPDDTQQTIRAVPSPSAGEVPPEHHMQLLGRYYRHVEAGRKTIEVKVAASHKRGIGVGDTVVFHDRDTGRELDVIVQRITPYSSFEDLLRSAGTARIDPDGPPGELLASLRGIYPPDEEALGVLALVFDHAAGEALWDGDSLTRRPKSLSEEDRAGLKEVRARCPELDTAAGHVRGSGEILSVRLGATLSPGTGPTRTRHTCSTGTQPRTWYRATPVPGWSTAVRAPFSGEGTRGWRRCPNREHTRIRSLGERALAPLGRWRFVQNSVATPRSPLSSVPFRRTRSRQARVAVCHSSGKQVFGQQVACAAGPQPHVMQEFIRAVDVVRAEVVTAGAR